VLASSVRMGQSGLMSEQNKSAPKKQWIEFGPLLVFFIVYVIGRRTLEDPNTAIYPAALVLAVLSIATVSYTWLKDKTVPGVLIFSAVAVCFFAGIAYFFQDPRFFYIKPTIMNALFGFGVIGGVLFKKNVLKILLMDAFELPDKHWNVLAIRWGIFFFVLAGLNELVWRTQSEPFWVNFKLFGLIPLTFIFTASQFPYIMKHGTVKGQE